MLSQWHNEHFKIVLFLWAIVCHMYTKYRREFWKKGSFPKVRAEELLILSFVQLASKVPSPLFGNGPKRLSIPTSHSEILGLKISLEWMEEKCLHSTFGSDGKNIDPFRHGVHCDTSTHFFFFYKVLSHGINKIHRLKGWGLVFVYTRISVSAHHKTLLE